MQLLQHAQTDARRRGVERRRKRARKLADRAGKAAAQRLVYLYEFLPRRAEIHQIPRRGRLFAEDRVIGDMTVIEEEDEDAGTYNVYAYCVSSTAARDEYKTVNVAYAMFPAAEAASSTTAAALKDKLVAAGVTTGDAFKAALADQTTAGSGVLDNVLKNSFGYDAVDEYIYADGRKAGDCEVINCGTDYIAVVVYLGEGDVAWHATATNGVLSEKLDAWYEDLAAAYTVDVNEKAKNKISA